jgi:hypothetical protein
MSEPEPALTAAEGRHIKRLVEKTIKDCGMAIDRATGQYETINEQNALAMTILDGLTVAVLMAHHPEKQKAEIAANLHANHVVMRLAQAFKRPVQ